MGSLLTVDDLTDLDVEAILSRASALRRGGRVSTGPVRVLSLIFLEPSLRTRVGFMAAAARLGWQSVVVSEWRQGPLSMAESWFDTVRTVDGYSDAIVMRPGRPLDTSMLAAAARCPIINGGSTGPDAQHPTQALIDLYAMRELVGPPSELRLAIVGDPRMRAVRSLLGLLARCPPISISLVADRAHITECHFPEALRDRLTVTSWGHMGAVDVVYVAGIPHQSLPIDRREALLATAARVAVLPERCVLLSPMPVIDEMDPETCRSARNRMFEQSDLGLYVRMALLEHVMR
jgi:aspartate carbamoyltransferase catalytic subunit